MLSRTLMYKICALALLCLTTASALPLKGIRHLLIKETVLPDGAKCGTMPGGSPLNPRCRNGLTCDPKLLTCIASGPPGPAPIQEGASCRELSDPGCAPGLRCSTPTAGAAGKCQKLPAPGL